MTPFEKRPGDRSTILEVAQNVSSWMERVNEGKPELFNQYKKGKIYDNPEFRQKILSGEQKLDIDRNKQAEHQPGYRRKKDGKRIDRWKKVSKERMAAGGYPNSILYPNIDPQELVDQYAGKGEFREPAANANPVEYITHDEYVGRVYNPQTQRYELTKRFAIYYNDSTGVHIYPVFERRKP